MMRKFFLGLGVLTALLLVAGGIGFFVLARNGEALEPNEQGLCRRQRRRHRRQLERR